MIIVMVRVLEEDEQKVLVEPYGTYDDWYDQENEDLRQWIKKSQVQAINDGEVDEWDDWSEWFNTEDPIEISVSHRLAERLLS
tara:strand:+ start:17050 stop:17298 length:249 start_codon:yes stop_codon:yes gene_type:complete